MKIEIWYKYLNFKRKTYLERGLFNRCAFKGNLKMYFKKTGAFPTY
jgi:hypothetical protein